MNDRDRIVHRAWWRMIRTKRFWLGPDRLGPFADTLEQVDTDLRKVGL